MRAGPGNRGSEWGAVVAAALLLVACQRGSDDVGAVSADEARQLNDVAAMLDANSVSEAEIVNDTGQSGDLR